MRAATLPALGAASAAVVVARVWLRVAPASAVRWACLPEAPARAGARRRNPPGLLALPWAVAAAGGALRANCLEQGVALTALLTLVRIPAHLVIGVERSDRDLRAHAWVESRGSVVLGAPAARDYAPLSLAVR